MSESEADKIPEAGLVSIRNGCVTLDVAKLVQTPQGKRALGQIKKLRLDKRKSIGADKMSDFEEWFATCPNGVINHMQPRVLARQAWDHQAKRIVELEQSEGSYKRRYLAYEYSVKIMALKIEDQDKRIAELEAEND